MHWCRVPLFGSTSKLLAAASSIKLHLNQIDLLYEHGESDHAAARRSDII